MDKLTDLTSMKFFYCFLIKVLYLGCFLRELFLKFVSKPTVSSRMLRHLSGVTKSNSGRTLSPVKAQGLIKSGISTYKEEFWMD